MHAPASTAPTLRPACFPSPPQDLVDVENKKLDRFHIKEHIQEAAHDIAAGNIIRSMQVCTCLCLCSASSPT